MSSQPVANAPIVAAAPGLRDRLVNLGYASFCLSPLGLAMVLTPSAKGMGTHQQLGLPPCTFLYLTGLPCPFCGMTTSWAHAAHLDPLSSIKAQPMGFVFFAMTAALAAHLLYRAATGRSGFQPEKLLTAIPLWGWYLSLLGVTMAWAYKISLVLGWISIG